MSFSHSRVYNSSYNVKQIIGIKTLLLSPITRVYSTVSFNAFIAKQIMMIYRFFAIHAHIVSHAFVEFITAHLVLFFVI